ncbi:MAG: hypothetical protein ACXADL_17145 [Candidatus Thorarchaeota archaeon]|jgi:hypothetical protein
MKSLSVEGSVFWLVVSAVVSPPLAYYPGSLFFEPALFLVPFLFSTMYIVIAYFCWNQNARGFVAAMVLAISVLAMNIGFGGLAYPGDELLAIAQVLAVFFSFRGYREIREVTNLGGQ